MKLSQLFTKTARENPSGEVSLNAQLLERGSFIYKNSAGIYSFLPLGWRVMNKIEGIIREEMNKIGGQEIFMPSLVEKRYLDATGRWDVEIGFEAKGKKESKAGFVLGWTHEEVLTEIAMRFISSYKDLPFSAYQIQTKFRNEPRAKSGLLRGREFIMKDLYSFHSSENDLWSFYEKVRVAYKKIFERCGLDTEYVIAAGGDFTVSNTHEFQVINDVGEDTIYVCQKCRHAENKEISKLKDGGQCSKCSGLVKEHRSIEVGNIFPLGTKYSEAFGLKFVDVNGVKKLVIMGSYGIGLGRVMGALVEVHHDERGIVWPESVAPFSVHLIVLDDAVKEAEKIYKQLTAAGKEILFDDRTDKTAGEKFADADLIGIPLRVVVSKRTLEKKSVEVKKRSKDAAQLVLLTKLIGLL